MPLTKSAIKKMRQDQKRTKGNKSKMLALKEAIKKAKKEPGAENVTKAISLLDKATKNHLFHKNKASRLKSRLAKLIVESASSSKTEPLKKKRAVKTSRKSS